MTNGDGQANLALIRRMYDCFNRGDLDTIRNEIFAADLVWNLPGRHPLAGTKNGADEVLSFFDQLRRANVQVTLDPDTDPATGIDSFGADTVVEVHRGHGTATSGAELNAYNCTHYRIVDGRIALVQVYISDQYSVDDFFNAVYQLKPIPDRLA
jgi:hypothetical protein